MESKNKEVKQKIVLPLFLFIKLAMIQIYE